MALVRLAYSISVIVAIALIIANAYEIGKKRNNSDWLICAQENKLSSDAAKCVYKTK